VRLPVTCTSLLIDDTLREDIDAVVKLLTVCPGPPPEPSGANRGCVAETFVAKGI